MKHSFGFRIYGTPDMRLWIGPSLSLYAGLFEDETNENVIYGTIGGGPEIGCNYLITEKFSIGLTAG